MIRAAALLLACGLAAACVSPGGLPPLASASAAPDFGTYQLRRVALLPISGEGLGEGHAEAIQGAFHLELGRTAPYELVRLTPLDIAEIYKSEPHRRGSYHPRTLLDLAHRYRVDAVMIGTVTQFDVYPPQVLNVDLVLVSCETGMILWTANVHMDASDAIVREHLEWYQRGQAHSENWEDGVQLTLISPTHFARFAASEVAKQL